ncbi:MAG: response regulator [Acidobacteriota bacterium]
MSQTLLTEPSAAGATDATAVATPPVEQSVKKILLLDGVRVFLRLEETLLQRCEHELFSASTGAEALEILEREDIDLLVLDHSLPDMGGAEVITRARELQVETGISILLLSARDHDESLDDCIAAGCDAFLHKPVQGREFCAQVETLLDIRARRHVRTLVRLQVKARCVDRFFFGHTVNVSEGGMLLESPLDMAVGECLGLRFFLPGTNEAISCLARIVRNERGEGGERRYGITFDEICESDLERLAEFVAHHAPTSNELVGAATEAEPCNS